MKPLSPKQSLICALGAFGFAAAAESVCANKNIPHILAIFAVGSAAALGAASALAPFMIEKEDIQIIKKEFRKLFRRDRGGPTG